MSTDVKAVPLQELHPNLAQAAGMVAGLAATFGPRSEVVVHDLSRVPNSIVAIAGGLTGRKAGGPTTNFLLGKIRAQDFNDSLNYMSTTPEGRTLRSSTLFIRDAEEVLGCLCVNVDVTEWKHVSAFAEWNLSGTHARAADLPSLGMSEGESRESYPVDVDSLRRELLSRAIEDIGIAPDVMHRTHKIAIVERLENEGFFMLRESVPQLATALSVTRHSIYNYLSEVRGNADAAAPSSPKDPK
ncbi:PAS domain-containing protein [Salipiger sp. P9]|uniref:helix-turn-helix transcriptional regulator n=1 Tax=Salipiger pentaromativorans TaxID=2943193 RepID=UPI002157B3AB|nr:PAS domain-containing protein [Salipiger pentaromativorans]MCR8549181.1 PAS domain-containing protein [Salipiger pentaromativorans]